MVFFSNLRLGKIDKGGAAKDGADGSKASEKAGDGAGAAGGSSLSGHLPAAAADSELQREPEKREKKSKKPKHTEDALSGSDPLAMLAGSGGAGSSSSVAALPAATGPGAGSMSSSSTNRAQAVGLSVNDFISKTKNQQRQGLKPSGPELIAYARYLGIDPVADHDLLWIAVEALEAPLPSDWTEHFDSNDRVFYYNATMRVSSWTHPLEHIYRETYKTIVNFRNANMSAAERHDKLMTLQAEVKQMELEVHKEIAQWTEHTDEQGNRFYFNREERQSTWTDPRPAKCQILYLRMKMLRLLASSTGGIGAPGFADSKGDGLGSRFPFSGLGGGVSEPTYEDPAFKRPKVGAERSSSSFPAASGAEGADDGGREQDSQPFRRDKSPVVSDSDSDDERKKKKKKKKKKKDKHREAEKPRDSDDRLAAAPPPRLGQNLRNSQSEPSVGGKPLLATVEDARGGGGAGLGNGGGGLSGLQSSASANGALSINASAQSLFDHPAEGLSNVGRTRIKAGIRLEPLGPGGAENRSGGPGSAMEPMPKGVRGSASVPSL